MVINIANVWGISISLVLLKKNYRLIQNFHKAILKCFSCINRPNNKGKGAYWKSIHGLLAREKQTNLNRKMSNKRSRIDRKVSRFGLTAYHHSTRNDPHTLLFSDVTKEGWKKYFKAIIHILMILSKNVTHYRFLTTK